MKRTIKNYLKLGVLLLGISATMVNCQKDDEFTTFENHQDTNSKARIIETDLNTLLSKESFSNAFTKVFKKTSKAIGNASVQRTVMENEYGFTIVQDGIKVISNEGFTSYTMLIRRAESNTTYFENLVIDIDDERLEEPKAILMKYTPSSITPYLNHNSFNFEGEIEATSIVYNMDEEARLEYECNNVTTGLCNHDLQGNVTDEIHLAGTECGGVFWQFTTEVCDWVFYEDELSDGGGNISDGTTSGDPSGGGSSSSDGGGTTPPDDDDCGKKKCNTDTVVVIPEELECVLSEENADAIAFYLASNTIPPSLTPTLEAAIFANEAENAICHGTVATFDEYVELMQDCNTSMEDLKLVFPNTPDTRLQEIADYINEHGKDFGIDTKEELQHFLSQAGHESTSFTDFTEGLNYRVNLLGVEYWWKYFNPQTAYTTPPTTVADPTKENPNDYIGSTSASGVVYVNNETFANHVYDDANREYPNLLGNTATGDGYKYRGRGIIQLTGKTNYTDFNTYYQANVDSSVNLVTNPDLVASNVEIAVISSLWFFKNNVIDVMSNEINDNTTVEAVTLLVNGGDTGLPHREELQTLTEANIDCL